MGEKRPFGESGRSTKPQVNSLRVSGPLPSKDLVPATALPSKDVAHERGEFRTRKARSLPRRDDVPGILHVVLDWENGLGSRARKGIRPSGKETGAGRQTVHTQRGRPRGAGRCGAGGVRKASGPRVPEVALKEEGIARESSET